MSQVGDTLPLTNTMEVKETYKGSPKESGSICIETTVESYVVLDIYAIVQKWNSYRFQGRRQ